MVTELVTNRIYSGLTQKLNVSYFQSKTFIGFALKVEVMIYRMLYFVKLNDLQTFVL